MSTDQLSLALDKAVPETQILTSEALHNDLVRFRGFGKETSVFNYEGPGGVTIPTYVNEFWTSRQRAAHSLHEISYRACFKPQLPWFFISRLTEPNDMVYDPFMGRGTTLVEAALRDRLPVGCDLNPLSVILVEPRLTPPRPPALRERLERINLDREVSFREDLLVFYHPATLNQIGNLRAYLRRRQREGKLDSTDRWIRMVATNRLTGHSTGFFSVYTLPPNQAVSVKSQIRINDRRNQTPPKRDVRDIIFRKSRSLLSKFDEYRDACLPRGGERALFLTQSCDKTPQIKSNSIIGSNFVLNNTGSRRRNSVWS